MSRWLLLLFLAALLVACGGKDAGSANDAKVDLDADPLALLPASAVVVANIDARTLFDSPEAGRKVEAIATVLVPLGDSAGFQAKRDVDRVVLGTYASTGLDVAAIVSGRFDPGKIAAATATRTGAPITRGVYAGRPTYTVGAVTYAVLSPKTLVAGTTDGLRRVLERVAAGKIQREMPPWVIETLGTPGAEIALAADFGSQPVAAAAASQVSVPWLKGMRVARVLGDFEKPGMNVAATVTYGDAQEAASAADGVRFVDGWLKVLGPMLGGLTLQNLDVKTSGADMQCKFAVDDSTLANLIAIAPRVLPASP